MQKQLSEFSWVERELTGMVPVSHVTLLEKSSVAPLRQQQSTLSRRHCPDVAVQVERSHRTRGTVDEPLREHPAGSRNGSGCPSHATASVSGIEYNYYYEHTHTHTHTHTIDIIE